MGEKEFQQLLDCE